MRQDANISSLTEKHLFGFYIITWVLLLHSALYLMIPLITMPLVQMVLKWHWTFCLLFTTLYFRIRRLQFKSGLTKDITYFLVVCFHFYSSLKIPYYLFHTRRDHLFFSHRQITGWMSETCLLYWAVLNRWLVWESPRSHQLRRKSIYMLLQFQVEVQWRAYMCLILMPQNHCSFFSQKGLILLPFLAVIST